MSKYASSVKVWIFIGLVMLVVQVVVGGITRITGSGLSITKWEIVTGTLPPMSEAAWEEAFDLYKATPQYEEINEGMQMGSVWQGGTFKFIYFWEWIHRLWARLMGFVFLIPFLYFWFAGYFDGMLKRRMIGVFLLAGLAASFGWIMVASGLVERPWVNAYKLALHLSIAFLTYAHLLWTYYKVTMPDVGKENFGSSLRFGSITKVFTAILAVQIFLGGVMSGMKAGVVFPTWPDMHGTFIPQVIFDAEAWTVQNFNYYDRHDLLPALIQTLHRLVAYALFFLGVWHFYKVIKAHYTDRQSSGGMVLLAVLCLQVTLGIITVINCDAGIPLLWGVLHQFVALMLLTAALYMNYQFTNSGNKDR